MPEGPEVRRAADAIERAVAGRPLDRVTLWDPALDADGLRAAGLVRAETHGKALVLRFGDGRGVYVHLQLYGRWRFGAGHRAGGRTLRLSLVAGRAGAFLYSATDLALLAPGEIHPFVARQGPDPLAADVTADAIARSLARAPRRALGAVLLDPERVAGIGNYLRADLLWEAEISPTRSWSSLGPDERDRLVAAILAVPRRSLANGGVTVPATFAPGLSRLPRRARRHAAYGRAGMACLRCDDVIVRAPVGGRPLYFCPVCQR